MIKSIGGDFIISRLEDFGYKAYYVGGCVRNCLLNKPIKDYDITTNASPNSLCEIFSEQKLLLKGLKHGTVGVLINGEVFEVTTFRKESSYSDFRRPDKVEFCDDLLCDLSRRDFTINAMAYNKNIGIIDNFGGVYDTHNRLLKCVGEPIKRFEEDALRILRGMRLASVYGLTVEQNTANAMIEKRNLLTKISAERILSELSNLLTGDNVLTVLTEFKKVIITILPELATCDNLEYCFLALTKANDLVTKYAILLFFCKDDFLNISRRLRFDNKTRDIIINIYKFADFKDFSNKCAVKKVMSHLRENTFTLINFLYALQVFQSNEDLYLQKIAKMEEIYYSIINANECYTLSMLAITGNDVLNLGYEGEQVKKILNNVLNAVINDEIKNNKQEIIEYVKNNG